MLKQVLFWHSMKEGNGGNGEGLPLEEVVKLLVKNQLVCSHMVMVGKIFTRKNLNKSVVKDMIQRVGMSQMI